MIIKTTIVTVAGVTYNSLTYSKNFWACWCKKGTVQIVLMTPDWEPMYAKSKTGTLLEGFGSTTYAGLLTEIKKRGFDLPNPWPPERRENG